MLCAIPQEVRPVTTVATRIISTLSLRSLPLPSLGVLLHGMGRAIGKRESRASLLCCGFQNKRRRLAEWEPQVFRTKVLRLNYVPQRGTLKSQPPAPMNMTLLGSRAFADVSQDEVMLD